MLLGEDLSLLYGDALYMCTPVELLLIYSQQIFDDLLILISPVDCNPVELMPMLVSSATR